MDAAGNFEIEGDDVTVKDGDNLNNGFLNLQDNSSVQRMGLKMLDNSGGEYVALRAPLLMKNNTIIELPDDIPSTGEVLSVSVFLEVL
jgi:hypothetical protein